MKYCSVCKTTEGRFVKYAKNKQGKQYYICNLCNKKRAKKNYEHSVKIRENKKEYNRKYAQSNKDKRHAYYLIRTTTSVQSSKKLCFCGEGNTEAHHPNGYDGENALKVIWLCRFHHREMHKKVYNGNHAETIRGTD